MEYKLLLIENEEFFGLGSLTPPERKRTVF